MINSILDIIISMPAKVQMQSREVFLHHEGERTPQGAHQEGTHETQLPQVPTHDGLRVGAGAPLRGGSRGTQEVRPTFQI